MLSFRKLNILRLKIKTIYSFRNANGHNLIYFSLQKKSHLVLLKSLTCNSSKTSSLFKINVNFETAYINYLLLAGDTFHLIKKI